MPGQEHTLSLAPVGSPACRTPPVAITGGPEERLLLEAEPQGGARASASLGEGSLLGDGRAWHVIACAERTKHGKEGHLLWLLEAPLELQSLLTEDIHFELMQGGQQPEYACEGVLHPGQVDSGLHPRAHVGSGWPCDHPATCTGAVSGRAGCTELPPSHTSPL